MLASVAVHSTPLATIGLRVGLRVQLHGFLGEGFLRLKVLRRGVCREAGARVRTSVRVRDMDLLSKDRIDTRRLLLLTVSGCMVEPNMQQTPTLVSPLARDGSAKRGADRTDGSAQSLQE